MKKQPIDNNTKGKKSSKKGNATARKDSKSLKGKQNEKRKSTVDV